MRSSRRNQRLGRRRRTSASWSVVAVAAAVWAIVCCASSSSSSAFVVVRRRRRPSASSSATSSLAAVGRRHGDPSASSFPPEIPSGLRGNAVRTGLVYGNGLCYELTDARTFAAGVVRVSGTRPDAAAAFLHAKCAASFDDARGTSRETCVLTARGRVVDLVSASVDEDGAEALVVTSPFHGPGLHLRWAPSVFPMDGVTVTDASSSVRVFCVAAVDHAAARAALERAVVPLLRRGDGEAFPFPAPGRRATWTRRANDDDDDEEEVVIGVSEGGLALPACVARGYSLSVPRGPLADRLWTALAPPEDDENLDDAAFERLPLPLSPREWESLRIEGGRPGYGSESTADDPDGPRAGPLELCLPVDADKGCYQGQEGVAAALRSPRGVPRTLYSVVFDDDDNGFDEPDRENTPQPRVGDDLYALGSDETIKVGTLTSVAEPGSTCAPCTKALALVRRSGPILEALRDMDIEIGGGVDDDDELSRVEGYVPPPPPDPLDGLEVLIGGTFTVGKLRSIASRLYPTGHVNMFDPRRAGTTTMTEEPRRPPSYTVGVVPSTEAGVEGAGRAVFVDVDDGAERSDDVVDVDASDDDDEWELARMFEEAARAKEEAERAAENARRKADEMETLRRRAEEALAARTKKAEEARSAAAAARRADDDADDAIKAEARRKEEKMALLKARAEAAMAARKRKAEEAKAARRATEADDEDAIAAEAQRKEEKMALLKARAEEAMAARKRKAEHTNGGDVNDRGRGFAKTNGEDEGRRRRHG